jgi:hypothetical protein
MNEIYCSVGAGRHPPQERIGKAEMLLRRDLASDLPAIGGQP